MTPTIGKRAALAALGAAGLACAGCDLGAPPDTAPPGTISGAVRYEGGALASGTLVVEAHATMPPSGPALASATIPDARFPQAYTLGGLAAGEVFLVARLADAEGAVPALGTYPSILSVSPVVLDAAAGLRGADFDLVDEGSHPEGPLAVADARTIAGVVRYDGAVLARDTLRGALYRSYPASGTPADFQILNVEVPAFPFSFEFAEVRDGAYYVVFYLDRGDDSPFGPDVEDVVAWALGPGGEPVPATVALGAGATGVDVVLP